jgi:hypothetical protein
VLIEGVELAARRGRVQGNVRTPRFPALLPSPVPSNSGRSARGEPGTPSSASFVAARAPKPSSAIAILRRLVWVWLFRVWPNWRSALCIVKPETVIAWHRQGSRLHWKWKSRVRHGRPSVPTEVQNLIQKMSSANPWSWLPCRTLLPLVGTSARLRPAPISAKEPNVVESRFRVRASW